MSTVPCKEQILAALEARLATLADAFPGLLVDRNRDEILTDEQATDGDQLTYLGLFEASETPHGDEESFSGERGYTLSVTVEGVMTGANPADAKTQLAVLRAATERAVLADLLGQMARDIRLMPEPPPPRLELDCEQPYALFVAGFEIDYATLEADPFTFAD